VRSALPLTAAAGRETAQTRHSSAQNRRSSRQNGALRTIGALRDANAVAYEPEKRTARGVRLAKPRRHACGKSSEVRNGIAYDIKAGDVVVIPAGTRHWSTRIDDHIDYIMVRIDPDKVTPLKSEADYLSKRRRASEAPRKADKALSIPELVGYLTTKNASPYFLANSAESIGSDSQPTPDA
jgi:hypothetical protein